MVICGVDTSRLPKLTYHEQTELLTKIKSGDRAARQKFITANMRLILSLIQKFWSKRTNADDIFQVGCIGLIKAIDNFDLNQGVRFSTYAVPMIIGEIRRYLRDNNSMRVSRSLRDIAYKALKAREILEREMADEPTTADIAAHLSLPLSEVVCALDAVSEPVSLYEPVYHQSGDTAMLMDQIPDNRNSSEKWIESVALKEAVKILPNREKEILFLRYFKGKTQMEVSTEIGISQAQVSRLEKTALSILKTNLS